MLLKYGIAWLGMIIFAIINGTIREILYKPYVGELLAHQIATVVLLLIFTAYFWLLVSYWPIESGTTAWEIGLLWVLLTLAFEFGAGRFIFGNPWSKLLHDYNLLAGRIWVLIPLWVLIAPYVLSRIKLNH